MACARVVRGSRSKPRCFSPRADTARATSSSRPPSETTKVPGWKLDRSDGARTLRTTLADETVAKRAVIVAPASIYASSGYPAPAPARRSTVTVASLVRRRTSAGTRATRRSPEKCSAKTPTLGRSSSFAISALHVDIACEAVSSRSSDWRPSRKRFNRGDGRARSKPPRPNRVSQDWSDGNDDFPELAAGLEIAVDFRHLIELECPIDDGLERTIRETPCDVFDRDLSTCFVARYQPKAVPLDDRHLGDHLQYGNGSVAFAQRAIDVDDAPIGECGDQPGEIRAAYSIEGDALAMTAGNSHHFGDHILLLGCNDMCGAS